jgi:hypothetical protein
MSLRNVLFERRNFAMGKKRLGWVLSVAAILVACATYGVMLRDGHTIIAFAGKEQFFEHLSAWLFLLSSLLALGAWERCRRRGGGALRQTGYVLLALFFLVAFGEELSWGQHYFGYATPDSLSGLNQQGELNFHNMRVLDSQGHEGRRGGIWLFLNSNRLFDYFMIGLFLFLPLGNRFLPWVRRLIEWFSLPVVAVLLGIPLLLNWILTFTSETWLVTNEARHMAVSEIRELNYAVLCALGLLWLFLAERKGADDSFGEG